MIRLYWFLVVTTGLAIVGVAVPAASVSKAGEPTPYHIVNGRVDPSTYRGWEIFHSACIACHGKDAVGTDIAPSLVEALKRLSMREFTIKVLTRYRIVLPWSEATSEDRTAVREALMQEVMRYERSQRGELVMPAWESDDRVKPHILDLYAYLKARADGALGPGHPLKSEESADRAGQARTSKTGK